jgi:hypothetical protein
VKLCVAEVSEVSLFVVRVMTSRTWYCVEESSPVMSLEIGIEA